MANIRIETLKSDIQDRADNSVLGQQISDAMRQKLITTKRLNRAMTQAYFLFVKDADAAALQQLTAHISLEEDTNTPVVEALKTYIWPESAYQERIDGGIVNLKLDGQERLMREQTPLESVRMQAGNVFYGGPQRVFAVDQQQKRIYIPEDVVASARIIRTPQIILEETEGFIEVESYAGAGTPLSVDVTVDGTTENELFSAATSNEVTAANLVTAINATGLAYAVRSGAKVYVKSLSNEEATIVINNPGTAFSEASIIVNATGSYELPISDVYNETFSALALQELIKMSTNPNNVGIIGQQVPVPGAAQPQEA